MTLRPIPTYDSWSLACILSWSVVDQQRPANEEDAAIREELRSRGKSDADIAEMVGLAAQVGRWLNPPGEEFGWVYLGIEDLFLGIDRALGEGAIDEAERDRLWEVLRVHWVRPEDRGRA